MDIEINVVGLSQFHFSFVKFMHSQCGFSVHVYAANNTSMKCE